MNNTDYLTERLEKHKAPAFHYAPLCNYVQLKSEKGNLMIRIIELDNKNEYTPCTKYSKLKIDKDCHFVYLQDTKYKIQMSMLVFSEPLTLFLND